VIFFDLDDTLLDDRLPTARGLDALYQHHGAAFDVPRHELTQIWKDLLDQHFPRYLSGELTMQGQRRARLRAILGDRSDSFSDDDIDTAFSIYTDSYERGVACFPDVVPMLERLARDTRLGVITNGNREQQYKKLERTALGKFFDTVVTPEACGAAKPDPRIFAEACRRAGVAAADAIYVGDNWDIDVVGSRAAGLKAIWINRDTVPHREIPADVSVIETLSDLPALVKA